MGGGNISSIAYSGLIQEVLEFLLGEGENISMIAYSGLIQEFLEFLLGEGENKSIAYSGYYRHFWNFARGRGGKHIIDCILWVNTGIFLKKICYIAGFLASISAVALLLPHQ